ncbi:helix-turn-helix domain-containing protein [Humidisolicoccus flavus]|uniref:helix-turn-helix domain-containing protein n=1 Tax=Humidisolicoccus flavus TaxID=3111414 RepID=UPI00324E6905
MMSDRTRGSAQRDAASIGRPKAASPEMLAEAAFELFLERGYDKTTVGDITLRAGVARSTFFMNFSAKADILWSELDPLLQRIQFVNGNDEASVVAAFVEAVAPLENRVPRVLRDRDAMGVSMALAETAITRLQPIVQSTAHSLGQTTRYRNDASASRTRAVAIVSVSASALLSWSELSSNRETAAVVVARALQALSVAP